MTIYPVSSGVAKRVAADLHELTRNFHGPRVPYDLPYKAGSCVHYRYGGFRMIEVVFPDGRKSTAIRDPSGKFWTDRREPGHAVPEWILNPFEVYEDPPDPTSPLCTQFLTYEALSQRGKGGTYLSVDIREVPAKKCVLKEGRRHGETAIDGRDGRDFLLAEENALSELASRGVRVPKPFVGFDLEGQRYLTMEFIEGTNLMALCSHPRRKLPLPTADLLAARIAHLVSEIHAAGWVWRDLKPLNLIISSSGDVRPVDFEGAVRVNEPNPLPWGTPGYTPPELRQGPLNGSNLPEDLFALGATLHQLYSSTVPTKQKSNGEIDLSQRLPLGTMRRGVHPNTRKMIGALLDLNPQARPSAALVAEELMKRVPSTPVTIDASKYQLRARKKNLEDVRPRLADEIPGIDKVVLQVPVQDAM